MRNIQTDRIVQVVRDLAMQAATDLGNDVLDALERAQAAETSTTGIYILGRLIENAGIARREKIPMCQDTGMAVVFIEMGQEVHIEGGSLKEAIHEGVRWSYADGYLRKSVCDPITRENTGDNTPAVIHLEVVGGERFKIMLAMKGFGSENMSRVTMLPPSAGIQGVRDFIVQRVSEAGSNPCPPTIIGVGIGGTMEMAALMAKKALLRPLGTTHPDPKIGRLEDEWLEAMQRFKAVYMAAIGGAGALMAESVRSVEMVAYPELGTEAIRRLVIEDMPLIVVNDVHGGDLYVEGVKAYRRD